MQTALTILMFAVLLAPMAANAGDVAAGQAAFNRCRICHAVEAGKPSPVGPNLHGVFARKAGTLGNFAYSEAMKQSGVVWNGDTLTQYLRDPKAFLPGNRMAFPGIKNEADIADLLAYLRQATQ